MQLRRGPLRGPSGLQTSDDRQPPGGAAGEAPLLVFRNDRLGAAPNRDVILAANLDAKPLRGRYANHRDGVAIQAHSTPQDPRVGAEFPLPECVADHGAGIRARRPVVLPCKSASESRLDTEKAKE